MIVLVTEVIPACTLFELTHYTLARLVDSDQLSDWSCIAVAIVLFARRAGPSIVREASVEQVIWCLHRCLEGWRNTMDSCDGLPTRTWTSNAIAGYLPDLCVTLLAATVNRLI